MLPGSCKFLSAKKIFERCKSILHTRLARERKELLALASKALARRLARSLSCTRCLRNRAVALVSFRGLRGDNIVKKLSLHLFQISGGEGIQDFYIVGNGEEKEEEEEEESGEELNGGVYSRTLGRGLSLLLLKKKIRRVLCVRCGVAWEGRGSVCLCSCDGGSSEDGRGGDFRSGSDA